MGALWAVGRYQISISIMNVPKCLFCQLLHAILVTTYYQIQIMSAPLEVVKGDILRENGKLCETAEKKYLNIFFLLFWKMEKRWKKKFKFFFLLFLEKQWRKKI